MTFNIGDTVKYIGEGKYFKKEFMVENIGIRSRSYLKNYYCKRGSLIYPLFIAEENLERVNVTDAKYNVGDIVQSKNPNMIPGIVGVVIGSNRLGSVISYVDYMCEYLHVIKYISNRNIKLVKYD